MNWRSLLLLIPGLALYAAGTCDPAVLTGPYAFPIDGHNRYFGFIAAHRQSGPAGLRHGTLTGTASAAFRGLILENPVTGITRQNPIAPGLETVTIWVACKTSLERSLSMARTCNSNRATRAAPNREL